MPIYKPGGTGGPTGNPQLELPADVWGSIRDIQFDGRQLANAEIPADIGAKFQANTLANTFLYFRSYRLDISRPLHDYFLSRRFIYVLQSDWTDATQFPEAPASAPDTDLLYYYQRIDTATSLGASGIADIPTSWRNYTGLYRIVLERNELTSAQQVGIVAGIEREILAGLGGLYTSTSTTARFIDFQSNSAGANDALVQADLVALGWTVVNATQLEKFLPDANGNNRRWRVLHQN